MGGLAPQRSFDPDGAVIPLGPTQEAHSGLTARKGEGVCQLERTARMLAPLGPPVVVFNASHSGSRLLAQMLKRLGVFMGSNLNESEDSLDLFDLVRYIVERHAPDFSNLFCDGDAALPLRAEAALDRPPGQAAAGPALGLEAAGDRPRAAGDVAAVSRGALHPPGARRARRRLLAVPGPEGRRSGARSTSTTTASARGAATR